MKVGLYGIYGVYNFGCEAIVRGAYKFIKNIFNDAEVVYYSYNYEYDKDALRDVDVEIQPIVTKKTIFDKVDNKIRTVFNQEKRVLYFDYERIINSVDMIVSIGGDIYTIPEVIRQRNTYPYYNQLVDFCDRAIEAGKDVIVYGASVGPFGNYIKAVNYYKKNLEKYKMIICREEESIKYLKSIGLRNVCFFPDPAFQIKGQDDKIYKPKYIGINLSPLSINETYRSYGEESYTRLAHLLDDVFENTNKELLFIPHVVSRYDEDNDLLFLKKIVGFVKNETRQHIHFANYDGGFLGLKDQLKECYLVVAARMHCAVNAIDENIPALFLSYSQKSVGMCEYVYDSKDWVVKLKDIDNILILKITDMLNKREDIVKYLIKRNKEIEKYYLNNLEQIKGMF